MSGHKNDEFDLDYELWREEEYWHALSPDGIAEQNRWLLQRYRVFRRAADAVAEA